MRNARFFAVLTAGWLLPFSLSAQSVTIKVPQPVIKVAGPVPLDLHLPSVSPIFFDESDRDLPVQEQETIQIFLDGGRSASVARNRQRLGFHRSRGHNFRPAATHGQKVC